MDQDWTEKYRPTTLSQVLGNTKAVNTLIRWASEWEYGNPGKRAVILAGPPGIGKTSTALALASDMGWGVVELNASDVRSGEKIRSIATRGALFDTFTDGGEFIRASEGGRKLIILDEADNLYERLSNDQGRDSRGTDFSDRGGKTAIVETIKKTMQPIILIVNDLYTLTKNSTLKTMCEIIKYRRILAPSIEKALIRIIRNEGIEVEREALEVIVNRSAGDLRAAINDLQALSRMGTRITGEMAGQAGFRDNVITLQEALEKIFKGTTTEVRKAAWDLDETPDSLLTWLDENLPYEYKDPEDLKAGYDALSRADVFLGRVRKRQYYRLWAYANDTMTAGVALAKKRPYDHHYRYRFPGWILKMSRTRGMRNRRKALGAKIGSMCHTSIKDARIELLPIVQTLFRQSEHSDFDFAVSMTNRLSLEPEEIAFLLGTLADDQRVTDIQERAIEHHRQATGFFPSRLGTKKADLAGLDVKKKKGKKVKKEKEDKETKKKVKKEKKENANAKKTAPKKGKGKGAGGKQEGKEANMEDGTEGGGHEENARTGDEPGKGQAGEGIDKVGTGKQDTNGEKKKKVKKEPKKQPEQRPEKAWF